MEKELFELYELASAYLDNGNNPLQIIRKASDLYVNHSSNIPQDILNVCGQCMLYVNKDFEENMTFDKYVVLGEELIETLSGVLGEHFAQ